MSLNKLRFYSPSMREEMLPVSAYDDLELTPNLHRWHPFHREMYLGARVMLPGHLLASKGDRVAMHSSVETRYAFLDEDLLAFTAKLHPRWKLRGLLRDKFVERKVAQKWLPKEVAWRRKRMFRAPMDSWAQGTGDRGQGTGQADAWIDDVLSRESLEKTGYFDAAAVHAARAKLARLRRRSLGRTGLEMGLTAVTATQLWHHLYISGDLCELKSNVVTSKVGTSAPRPVAV
jgi:asparagine synthase (glutamine-hydrolysing)